jgi:hypothetical protein
MLLGGARPPEPERARMRRNLLDYCEQDTLAMVKLVERLRGLASSHP